MDCSTPGFLSLTISWSLPKFMSIASVMPSSRLILCTAPVLLPSIFPRIRAFSMSQLFTSGDQSIGALASTSVLPINIQGWFPLRLTGLISLMSKGNLIEETISSAVLHSTEYNMSSVQSVAQSCPNLCDPTNRSMPGLPVHHQFPEFIQTHVHWVGDAIQPSHPLSSPSPPASDPSQHQSPFQWVNFSHEVAKVLEFQL